MQKLNKYDVLKQYFGYDTFRAGQDEIIDQILNKRDVVAIMPTGAGKSICYQIPALIFAGVTIVISPLISLMKDQVELLVQSGISATYVNSSLSASQYSQIIKKIKYNEYKIIYVAPERLENESFLEVSNNLEISMIAIDEAHCISQWGQDFRPSYLDVIKYAKNLKTRPIIAAFTATATVKVKDDIIDILELNDPYTLVTGFDRKNLKFSVKESKNKLEEIKGYIKDNKEKCGIVYCGTRKNVEYVYSELELEGINVARYHAGMTQIERNENQCKFINDEVRVMVATNAFGMGIDKSNVYYVIHYNMPMNLESYYQEAGRAGRDGSSAECILYYSKQDVITNKYLIEKSRENDELEEKVKEEVIARNIELLKYMTFYCTTKECLRKYMLRYFGERTQNYCGNCSNCNSEFEIVDITQDAQKIFCCIKRTDEKYGINFIAELLKGSKNKKILDYGYDKNSTYGLLKDKTILEIKDIINHLLVKEYLKIEGIEYPILKLSKNVNDVLFNNQKVEMKRLKTIKESSVKIEKTISYNENIRNELFDILIEVRKQIANSQCVPPYVIFSDASLKDMTYKLPKNKSEFKKIIGVSDNKLKQYGDDFIDEIKKFTKTNEIKRNDSDNVVDKELYSNLVKLRLDISIKNKMPAYFIFDNKTLLEIANKKPTTKEEMITIKGIKEQKYSKYGEIFIEEIKHYIENRKK